MTRLVLLLGSVLLTVVGLLVMTRDHAQLMGVDADLFATVLLAAALGGLTLLVLMWAARGQGSVQEPTSAPPRQRSRVRAGRPR